MKKKILAIFTFFVIILTINSSSVFASLTLNQLDYNIKVNTDGSMDVTEIWDLSISETNTVFKTFVMDRTRFTSIENVSVMELTNNQKTEYHDVGKYMYHVDRGGYYGLMHNGEFEIAWNVGLDDSSGRKKYQISYTVTDAIAVHNDCAELYWQAVGEDGGINIKDINMKVELPDNTLRKEDLKVWTHTPTLNGLSTLHDGGVITAIFEQIPSKNMVEIRATFPKDIIESSGRTDKRNALDDIIAEETKWADEANMERGMRNLVMIVVIGGAGTILLVAALLQFRAISKIKDNLIPKRTPIMDVDYFRELPREDATPAEALALIDERYANINLDLSDIFPATMMDLNLKGFVGFNVEKLPNGKENIMISIKEGTNPITLKEDEAEIYNFLVVASERYGSTDMSMKQLQSYITNHPSKVTSLQSKINSAITKFLKQEEYLDFVEIRKLNKIDGIMGSALVIFILFIISMFSFLGFMQESSNIGFSIVPIVAFGIADIIYMIVMGGICGKLSKKITAFTQKGVDEIDKWKGLKDFMGDFSQMDQKELPSIVLWEHFLVYATAFNMAEKVIKQLKLVYPDLENDMNISMSTHSTFYMATRTNFSSSFSRAVSSSIASASSSGSGSGGGSSGGGGGGGGGGSSGGR